VQSDVKTSYIGAIGETGKHERLVADSEGDADEEQWMIIPR